MLKRLFTSKTRTRILEYLFFQKKETYLREIVRELSLSPNAVKREIDNLIAFGLVKKNKIKLV